MVGHHPGRQRCLFVFRMFTMFREPVTMKRQLPCQPALFAGFVPAHDMGIDILPVGWLGHQI